LQNSCTPQKWDAKAVALLGRMHWIINHEIIPYQTTPERGHLKNKWWTSSTSLHPPWHKIESLRRHPRTNKLYFVSNRSQKRGHAIVGTLIGASLFQMRSQWKFLSVSVGLDGTRYASWTEYHFFGSDNHSHSLGMLTCKTTFS
jgi:hypothetical protein